MAEGDDGAEIASGSSKKSSHRGSERGSDGAKCGEGDAPTSAAPPSSMFADLVDSTGPDSAAHLRSLVLNAHTARNNAASSADRSETADDDEAK